MTRPRRATGTASRLTLSAGSRSANARANELAAALQAVFEPVAPTIRVFVGAAPAPHPALSPSSPVEVIRWHNKGFGQSQQNQMNIYYSRRTKSARETWKPSDILRIDLGAPIAALIPLALFCDDQGTLPHAGLPVKPQATVPATAFSADDRTTRMPGRHHLVERVPSLLSIFRYRQNGLGRHPAGCLAGGCGSQELRGVSRRHSKMVVRLP